MKEDVEVGRGEIRKVERGNGNSENLDQIWIKFQRAYSLSFSEG